MAAATPALGQHGGDEPALLLGGYSALAESAWMGSVQATEVLEPLRFGWPRRRLPLPRLPRLRLAGLLTREFGKAKSLA